MCTHGVCSIICVFQRSAVINVVFVYGKERQMHVFNTNFVGE